MVSVPASRPPVPGSNFGPGPPHSGLMGGTEPLTQVKKKNRINKREKRCKVDDKNSLFRDN